MTIKAWELFSGWGLVLFYVDVFMIPRLMMAGCWVGGEQKRGWGGDECGRRFMMTN